MARLRKIVFRRLLVLGGGLLALCLAVIALAHFLFSPSRDEVSRVASPSGERVATVIEINGGATTSFGYEVRVSQTGFHPGSAKVALLYAAVRSHRAYGVNLRWVSDQELHVEYLSAQFAEVVSPGKSGPPMRVVLAPGISDSSAPPGGMLYNLQGRPHDVDSQERKD